jgi:hypothetical protein
MRNLACVLACLLFMCRIYGQTTKPATNMYMQKAKTQKTVAWTMLGGGIIMTTVGILIAQKKEEDFLNSLGNKGLGIVLEVAGIGASLGSIPFFISAAKNKRLAAAVSLQLQKTYAPKRNASVTGTYPALTVRMSL